MNAIRILQFTVQDVRLCIDLHFIKKIISLTYLERVPQCPYYLAGLLSYESQTLPVIDLALWFQLNREEPYTLEQPIIMCENAHAKVGMIVDNIIDLQTIDQSLLQQRDAFKSDSYFSGVIPIENALYLLINMNRMLANNFLEATDNIVFERSFINKATIHHE